MRDFIENLEAGAEESYYKMLQPDGRLKCWCGKIFDVDEEGGVVSPNPYAMPVCGSCFEEAMERTASPGGLTPHPLRLLLDFVGATIIESLCDQIGNWEDYK